MNMIINFIDWAKRNWANIRLGFILIIIVLLTLSFIGRKVQMNRAIDYAESNIELKTQKQILEAKNKVLDVRIANLNAEKKILTDSLIASEQKREANEREKRIIAKERDGLRAKLANLSSNELYQRLNDLYPFDGEKEYLINIKQVGEIVYVTLDYSLVKQEKEVLQADVSDCNRQVSISKALNLKNDSIIADLELKDLNNADIILNLEEQVEVKDQEIKRGKRRLFWNKVGMGTVIVIEAIVLAATAFAS